MHVPQRAPDIPLGGCGMPEPETLPWFSYLCVFLSNCDCSQMAQPEAGAWRKPSVIGLSKPRLAKLPDRWKVVSVTTVNKANDQRVRA